MNTKDASSKQNTEEVVEELPYREVINSGSASVFQFKYFHTGDGNGAVLNIGSENIKVTSSSNAKGKPEDFITREKVFCWTKNEPHSWFCVDLGPNKVMYVTHYTLGYGSSKLCVS